MNLLRITNGFNRLADAELEVKANNILASITGNSNFPTPAPTLVTIQTAITDYTNALSVAKSGSPYEKAIKNQKKEELITLLHSLGNYVLFTANGDVLVARSSGFSVTKDSTPAPDVSPAKNQEVKDGANPGELMYSFDKVPGAKSYLYQCTPDPITENSVWQSQPGTIRKTVFSGLESGKKYWCRVMAIGINGQGVYSDPVSRVVQ